MEKSKWIHTSFTAPSHRDSSASDIAGVWPLSSNQTVWASGYALDGEGQAANGPKLVEDDTFFHKCELIALQFMPNLFFLSSGYLSLKGIWSQKLWISPIDIDISECAISTNCLKEQKIAFDACFIWFGKSNHIEKIFEYKKKWYDC